MTEAELFRRIKDETKVIAIVGLSPKSDRPSWGVARYLQGLGYRIIPVNPGHAGEQILGETVYPDLAAIPAEAAVDMVEIFRRAEDVPPVVTDALATLPNLRTVWMQLGIRNDAAAHAARARGVDVVEDRCPAIEIPRLGL